MILKRWITVIVVVSMLTTGCWGRRELNELGIMVGIGVDLIKPGLYRVTYQEVNPSGVSPQGGGGSAAPINTFSTTGPTLGVANRKTAQKISRRILTPHVKILVIGEKAAREEGITKIMDLIERDDKFRWNAQLLIAKDDTAENILKVLTPIQKISALRLSQQVAMGEELWGEDVAINAMDAAHAIASAGMEPAIGGVELKGNPNEGAKDTNITNSAPPAHIDLNGMAIFKGDRLKHWMRESESRGLTWALNKVSSTIVVIDCPQNKPEPINIEILRAQSKLEPEIDGKKPRFHIKIRTEGKVAEVHCAADLDNRAIIERLEERTAQAIKKDIEAAVKVAQKHKSDIFGFGEAVHRSDPKKWDKLKKNWNNRFAESDVVVEVEALLRGTGLISNRVKKKG
ncbi:spore germination protein KC [Desmospora activa DSM 45169]|uniref:Spore germination protein KC n=1 Tax=Desmospora activa DSM 45169 TaxID=1121389 RepID=A0A2T4Z6Q4_9BACL|nr:spore germination protein KC [Desmospora activa DSM 45169]